MLDPVKNFARATVSSCTGGCSATTTEVTVDDGSKFPNPAIDGAFNIIWWNYTDYPEPSRDPNREIVRCTAISANVLTIIRAQEGTGITPNTTGNSHNTPGKIYRMILTITAKTINDINTSFEEKAHKNVANGYAGTDALNYVILARFQPITTVSSSYIIGMDDYTIVCSAGITVTLPTAVGVPGRIYKIKNTSTGTVTIATTSSQTIDGSTTRLIAVQNESITVQSNNANWLVI